MLTNRRTGRQIDRQADKQTRRQVGRREYRQTDGCAISFPFSFADEWENAKQFFNSTIEAGKTKI